MLTRINLTSQAKIQIQCDYSTLALKAQLISPAFYGFLQTSQCLTLPHQSTLCNLTFKSGLEYDFKEFLIKSTAKFTKQQRELVLNIDDVFVQSNFSYKGRKRFMARPVRM